jgi:hypothetical protein
MCRRPWDDDEAVERKRGGDVNQVIYANSIGVLDWSRQG